MNNVNGPRTWGLVQTVLASLLLMLVGTVAYAMRELPADVSRMETLLVTIENRLNKIETRQDARAGQQIELENMRERVRQIERFIWRDQRSQQ